MMNFDMPKPLFQQKKKSQCHGSLKAAYSPLPTAVNLHLVIYGGVRRNRCQPNKYSANNYLMCTASLIEGWPGLEKHDCFLPKTAPHLSTTSVWYCRLAPFTSIQHNLWADVVQIMEENSNVIYFISFYSVRSSDISLIHSLISRLKPFHSVQTHTALGSYANGPSYSLLLA